MFERGSSREPWVGESHSILKASEGSELPGLIERGAGRAVYVELPVHPLDAEIARESKKIQGKNVVKVSVDAIQRGVDIKTALRNRLSAQGITPDVTDVVVEEYELLKEIFRDYEILQVEVVGAKSGKDGYDLYMHPDMAVTSEYAVGARRVIDTLTGPASIYADDLEGTNTIQPNGRAITVHRFSAGMITKKPKGLDILEFARLGAYHRRPGNTKNRMTIVLDIRKKPPAEGAKEFRPE